MTDRIREHLDELLYGAPNTRRVEEMKQELLAGCLDKYEDLTAEGADPESAYREVVDGIGDVRELLSIIEKAEAFDPADAQERQRKRAFTTSAGILCYFIGMAIMVLFAYMRHAVVGFGVFVVFCGMATVLILFGRTINVPRYEQGDNTLVELLKVRMSEGGRKEVKMAGLASSTLWSFTVLLYLALSFLTMDWYITWIIFPFAAALQCCISAWFIPRTRVKSLIGAFWCLTVTIYLLLSYLTFSWHITWIVFPLAVAVQQAVRMFTYWRSEA